MALRCPGGSLAWLKVWGKLRKEKHKTSWDMKNLYSTDAEGKYEGNCVYLRLV